MIVATFWHADAARAERCVSREIQSRPEVNRVLQWKLGRMGVITRFYSVHAYSPTHYAPMCRDYMADNVDEKAALVFTRRLIGA